MANITPILIVGDAVSASTGLGRITREIAVRADAHLKDVCRIATMGYGGIGSRKFSFPQYPMEGMKDFVLPTLPEVWNDWAGNDPGIILFVWDPSRLGWFSRPGVMCELPALKEFLLNAKIQRWIYTPVDADGPHGKLSYPLVQSLLGFDRVLAYGQWAEGVVRRSLGNGRDLGSIPHGIDPVIFRLRDRAACRMNFFSMTAVKPMLGSATAILDDEPLVGCVATNQARKDWGLWAESCAIFLSRHPKARFWIHLDTLEKYWSIPQLLVDFGLLHRTVLSLDHLDDAIMAQAYSACDLTLGIGPEGFGFPIFESIFCSTPCITGNYGGAPEHLDGSLLVEPSAFRYEGIHCSKRPVYGPQSWADAMDAILGKRVNYPSHLSWEQIWPRFEAWFRGGLKNQPGTKP